MFKSRGSHRDREAFRRFIEALEAIPPMQLEERLVELGYRGQEPARKSVCLMAYRHVRRILRVFRDNRKLDDMLPKSNYLLMGPTGSGKTYIAQLLFNEILQVPSVTVDITAYSETGYVGQDPNAILTRLLHASNTNPLLAMIGVVCLDEFDKLASGANNAIFAGAGTTKDVTGRGVQRELLKMLEGAEIEVPVELSHSSYSERMLISTENIGFVACGAFSGFKTLTRLSGASPNIGYHRDNKSIGKEAIAVHLDQSEVERTSHFQSYGFMPELIGRFTRVVPFQPLDEDTLLLILNDNIIARFEHEFRDEGLELVITSQARKLVIRENLRKETGARGLSSILTRHLEEAAFNSFGQEGAKRVSLSSEDGHITCKVE